MVYHHHGRCSGPFIQTDYPKPCNCSDRTGSDALFVWRFLITQAAEDSGYLEQLTDKIFSHAQTGKHALLIILFIFGLSASILMNDTITIIGTPIIIQLCQSHKKLRKPLLFALAFSITIGSTLSPIGNPQNLLIAVKSEMPSPFFQFIRLLTISTFINLAITYLFICFIYRKTLDEPIEKPVPSPVGDHHTVRLVHSYARQYSDLCFFSLKNHLVK